MDANQAKQSAYVTLGKFRCRRRPTPPLLVWVALAAAGATIAIVRATDVMRNQSAANIVTLIAGFVGLMLLLAWFVLLSSYSLRTRMITVAVLATPIAVLAGLFRIDHVSGNLIPSLAFRFSPKPDQLLQTPKPDEGISDEDRSVDLLNTTDHDFPQFLGPGRDLKVEGVALARDWNKQPPTLVWRQEIGAGWSGFAVVGGYAVTMEQRGEAEMVTCYEVASGQLCWYHSTATRYDSTLAGVGPRATPTIDEGMVYTLGATARLLCLDGATGHAVWEKDLLKEYGLNEEAEEAAMPYGRANSPLVCGRLVIVPVGGPEDGRCVSLVAYDKKTGELAWEGGNRQASYSSPALATLAGARQILIVNQDYVSGHDPATGRPLWEFEWPGKSYNNPNVSQAVGVAPNRVFVSKGYGVGAALMQLVPDGQGTVPVFASVKMGLSPSDTPVVQKPEHFRIKEIWRSPKVMRTKFTNVAVRDGYVYGLSDGILECIELESGERMWKAGRYGHGQILLVGDLLLVMSESGEVILVEAKPDRRNNVLGHFQALEGMTWNNLAFSPPYLLVRNAEQSACYELPLRKER